VNRKRAAGGWLVAAWVLLACLAGCDESVMLKARPKPSPLAPPVEPAEAPGLAKLWYYGWVNEHDEIEDGDVRAMILVGPTSGRDWRHPAGPDGWAVRIVLLDHRGKPVRAPGTIEVFAVRDPERPTSEALYAWRLDEAETARRYRMGWAPGYVLELDWGRRRPTRGGTFMLVVRWTRADGRNRLTRNCVFEDVLHANKR